MINNFTNIERKYERDISFCDYIITQHKKHILETFEDSEPKKSPYLQILSNQNIL